MALVLHDLVEWFDAKARGHLPGRAEIDLHLDQTLDLIRRRDVLDGTAVAPRVDLF